MWSLPIVCRVGQSDRKIECGYYVICSQNSLIVINGKVQRSRIAVPLGSHSLVEFDYHTRIEELTWGHKGLQVVALHKPHGVPELREGSEGRKIIKMLIVLVFATTV